MRIRIALASIALLSAGCTVGPNYRRPTVAIPVTFRAPEPLPRAQAESVADLKWFEVFKDDKLQDLIRTALERNYDLRDAVPRVEAARAVLGVQRSFQYPNVAAGATLDINRLSRDGATPIPEQVLPFQDRNFGTNCCPSRSIFGAACAAPPRPRAPTCSARRRIAKQ